MTTTVSTNKPQRATGRKAARSQRRIRPVCAARILCVEQDEVLVESRCKLLELPGYDTTKASPKHAETILASQNFDLIVISNANEFEMNRIVNVSDGAHVLVLSAFTSPTDLLAQVADRLSVSERGRLS